jgi:hypothetical protein
VQYLEPFGIGVLQSGQVISKERLVSAGARRAGASPA